MIGVGWNCRGLGNPQAVRALKELIEEEDPGIIFLSETKLFVAEWDRMKARLGFRIFFSSGSEGRRGGLALLRRNSVDLSIKSYSLGHIDASIKNE